MAKQLKFGDEARRDAQLPDFANEIDGNSRNRRKRRLIKLLEVFEICS